jgi:hypothetical protein
LLESLLGVGGGLVGTLRATLAPACGEKRSEITERTENREQREQREQRRNRVDMWLE